MWLARLIKWQMCEIGGGVFFTFMQISRKLHFQVISFLQFCILNESAKTLCNIQNI